MSSNSEVKLQEDEGVALLRKYSSNVIEVSWQSPVKRVCKKNEDKSSPSKNRLETENKEKCQPFDEWTTAQRKEAEDLNKLPLHKMMMIIKDVNEEAYKLGVREAREISRCKYFGIFDDISKKQDK